MMKVCLINPPTTDPAEDSQYFPMALLTLGGVFKKQGVAAELWDFDLYFKKAGNSTEENFRRLLRRGMDGVKTNIFGVSSICSNLPMALWIAKEIKAYRSDSLVILGGPQPSSIPQALLERFEFIDLVAVGEGEVTLKEMIREEFNLENMSQIPGIATRRDGKVVLNPARHLTPNMDDFPFPDYSLIDFDDYKDLRQGYFTPHVEVGRGCPFNCTFCSTSLMWQKDFRVKSPQRILQEMEFLYLNHGFSEFDFIHDNFTTSRKFVADFCDTMEKHNKHNLKWYVSSRTDCLDVERLERMHAVGLRGVYFGIETGSKRMQGIIKKNLNFDRFEPIIRRGNELGLSMTTAFILGFPEEELEDMDESVRRALHYKSLGTYLVFFSKLCALTGTSIYRTYVDQLEETSMPSNLSPKVYGLPYIIEIIRKYPDLFSSFYHIPHPKFSKDYLFRFAEFASLLVKCEPTTALMVIEKLNLSATRLFEIWDGWATQRQMPYCDYRLFTPSDFINSFPSFLDEMIFKVPVEVRHHNSALAS